MGGVFYDDFPFIEPAPLCTLASHSSEGLLKALGWRYSDDPKKSHPLKPPSTYWCVRLQVANLHGGAFIVQNKPSRIEKIQKLLEETASLPQLSKRDAQVVHGNLNFAMGFFLGKSLMISARAFAHLTTDRHRATLEQVQQLCAWTHALIGELNPKTIEPGGEEIPVLIFTDAAYENDVATWGIVLIDTKSNTRTASGGQIPSSLVDVWHSLGSQQVITLAEAFAVLLARVSFRAILKSRRVIFWVDNEGARYNLIKGVSPTLSLLQIAQLYHSCGEQDNCIPWVERVPSKSNIADLPSRGQTNEALKIVQGEPWPFDFPIEIVSTLCKDFAAMPSVLQHGIVQAEEFPIILA